MLATAARHAIALMLKQPPGKWTSGYKQDKEIMHMKNGCVWNRRQTAVLAQLDLFSCFSRYGNTCTYLS